VLAGSFKFRQIQQPLRAFLFHDSAFDFMIKQAHLMFEYVLDDALGSKKV
jgi:hypothetical protein